MAHGRKPSVRSGSRKAEASVAPKKKQGSEPSPYRALVIVESPAKTRTLKNFLGEEFRVEASMGHVRDLPEDRFGVNIQKDFAPTYVILPSRREVIAHLKKAAQHAETVYLATDPDREGEAIAWHLHHALKLQNPLRIEFNEITESAVRRALQNPRTIDRNRVNAQQARRVLDRIVGYQLSPLLWYKLRQNTLSAGRVQSVAVRLIVEREREIRNFVPEEYWRIIATLTPQEEEFPFDAELKQKGDQKIELKTESEAKAVLTDLEGATYVVESVEKRQVHRQPPPPFITSTLQQEAARKLGFSARLTMRIAQELYEGVELGEEGHVALITYMRTDSTRVAEEAQQAARQYISQRYGETYLSAKPRQYKAKGNVQDAHEAIRPTSVWRTPESVASFLKPEQRKLYELIWKRFLASQMAEARLEVTTVLIRAKDYRFRTSGSVVLFPGFMSLYTEGKDTQEKTEEEQPPLPPLTPEQVLRLIALTPKQCFTQPPPRYTEATLVKTLEQHGIGRPSTYAPILSTIQDRGYVVLENRAFKPTPLGEVVNDYLVKHFPNIVDVTFTAHMEKGLDEIEEGKREWVMLLQEFYPAFKSWLDCAYQDKEQLKIPDEATEVTCPTCGRPMVVRMSRYGRFLGCSGYPDCKTTRPLGATGIPCPLCGTGEILQRRSKKGKTFYGCSRYPECKLTSRNKPTGERCPQCSEPLVELKRTSTDLFIGCSRKGCDYRQQQPVEAELLEEAASA